MAAGKAQGSLPAVHLPHGTAGRGWEWRACGRLAGHNTCQTQLNCVLYVKEEPDFSAKMSRPYDSMEPKVMDDDMLKAAVGEQGPQEEAGQLAKQEGILFKDVLSLQLDFQSMYPGCQKCGLGGAGPP